MGSCISKCNRKRKKQQQQPQHQEESESNPHVQDKLVISVQAPIPSSSAHGSLSSAKQSLSPTSTSSVSSLSCTTSTTNSITTSSCSLASSLSSSSSWSASSISSKERAFSNEFLFSCVKENPQIIRVDPIKGSVKKQFESPKKPHSRQFVGSTPQKRARGNSPVLSRQKSFMREIEIPNSTNTIPSGNSQVLSRQKSFRREIEIPTCTNSIPNRNLRSPSPISRRFSGENSYIGDLRNTVTKESCRKNSVVTKENIVNSGFLLVKRENIRPSSPSRNLGRNRACLVDRENRMYRIGSKIDEIAVGEVVSSQDVDAIPMEDIDNPLIALDCFIFL